jgi:hypothetical protein
MIKYMKTLFTLLILLGINAKAQNAILDLAHANGYHPSQRIVNAIQQASFKYKVDSKELTAIAILETGLGKYSVSKKNRNGTIDKGLFQINTINYSKCIEYNLDSPEGSALCAAKILSNMRKIRPDYLGAYHSKTPKHKKEYLQRMAKILAKN